MKKEKQPKGSKNQKRKRQGMAHKVYLVFLRTNIASREQPHSRLLAARLTRKEAEDIRDLNPGSYIHKVLATKAAKPEEAANGAKSTELDPDN